MHAQQASSGVEQAPPVVSMERAFEDPQAKPERGFEDEPPAKKQKREPIEAERSPTRAFNKN